MTEAEWLAFAEPEMMLREPRAWADRCRRKWRLFAYACLEPFRPHFPHTADFSAVLDLIARDTEREWTFSERLDVEERAVRILQLVVEDASEQRWHYVAEALSGALVAAVHDWPPGGRYSVVVGCQTATQFLGTGEPSDPANAREKRRQVELLRDIVGNPFRSVALDPAWLTTDVLALARGIYDERAFDRMPILADALQDAGCTNDDVLSHCRDANATHVRGCWVIDLVLGK